MLLAEGRLGKLDPALEGLGADPMGLGEIAQLQLVATAEDIALLGMILDQDPAGPGVADVQDQVDADRRERPAGLVREQLDLRQPSPGADQGEQIQVMGMMGKPRLLGLDIFGRQPQDRAGPVVEDLLDPAGDPGQLWVPADLVGSIGQGEGDAGVDVRQGGRQVLDVLRTLEDAGVDR